MRYHCEAHRPSGVANDLDGVAKNPRAPRTGHAMDFTDRQPRVRPKVQRALRDENVEGPVWMRQSFQHLEWSVVDRPVYYRRS